MRRVKPVTIGAHPSFYDKMETFRKEYYAKNGIKLSQVDITNIFSKRWRLPKINPITGVKNAKIKRRSN